MLERDTVTELLEAGSRILLGAFFLGMALLLLWFGVVMLLGDFVYAVHSAFFKISRAQFDAIHYAGMALTKIMLFLLFLFPYLATRWVLKKRKD
jgi:NADH:ubiquinone oxidoreductase subunit 6 (subunit J)